MALASLAGLTPRTPRHDLALNADLATLAHDPALAAKIAIKRQQEADRKILMSSPRLARIGLDVAGLNAQVAAKMDAIQEDAQDEIFYAKQAKLTQNVYAKKEEYVSKMQREIHKNCVDFSLANLRKEQRREYSLSDPNALKREKPPGKDSSVSSMQYFPCEETGSAEAQWQKKMQQREWLLAQMDEKREQQQREKSAEHFEQEMSLSANEVRTLCEHMQQVESQEERRAVMQDNVRLSTERQNRREALKARDEAVAKRHNDQVMAHNLERERHDYSVSDVIPGKKLDYKRCTLEQAQSVLDANKAAVLGRKMQLQADAYSNYLDARTGEIVEAAMQGVIDENGYRRLARTRAVKEENMAVARSKRESDLKERRNYRSYELVSDP